MTVEVGEYKGFPTIQVSDDKDMNEKGYSNTQITFGVKKARLILEHIDEIKMFVESNTQEK